MSSSVVCTCSDAGIKVHPEHFRVRQRLLGKRQLPLDHVPSGAPIIKPRNYLKFARIMKMLRNKFHLHFYPLDRISDDVEVGRRPRRSKAREVDEVVVLHPSRVRRGAVHRGHEVCHHPSAESKGKVQIIMQWSRNEQQTLYARYRYGKKSRDRLREPLL